MTSLQANKALVFWIALLASSFFDMGIRLGSHTWAISSYGVLFFSIPVSCFSIIFRLRGETK